MGKSTVSLEELNELRSSFSYDPVTGEIDRLAECRNRYFGLTGWNDELGYFRFRFNRKLYFGHRVAWMLTHGLIPDGMSVDHIDRNPSNNRIENLRLASHADNMRNAVSKVKSAHGFKGLMYNKKTGRYRHKIRFGGKQITGGNYSTAEEAARGYDALAMELHGEFARLNFPQS